MSGPPAPKHEIRFDDLGLAVNGVVQDLAASVEHFERAIGVKGNQVLLGPAHLAKNSDNRAVVFPKHGVVLLERIGDGTISQYECVFDPKAALLPGIEPYSGHLVLFGTTLMADIPRAQFIQLSSRSTRTVLDQVVFHSGTWFAYLTVERRALRKGPIVRVKRFSVGPSRPT